jgi:hypothetical protein
MRINVYNEELTSDVQVVTVEPRPGRKFIGVRLMLKSPSGLHHTPQDDDRSGVTFWLGTKEGAISYFENVLTVLRMQP